MTCFNLYSTLEINTVGHEDWLQIQFYILWPRYSFIDASEAELAGFAFTLFHEGFETTSTVLSFALHEIARHPEVQERIYKEIIQVSASYNDKFSYEALQEMIYLDCVIKGSHILNMYVVSYDLTNFTNNFITRITAHVPSYLAYDEIVHSWIHIATSWWSKRWR